jgi:hypothetical protein
MTSSSVLREPGNSMSIPSLTHQTPLSDGTTKIPDGKPLEHFLVLLAAKIAVSF